MLDDKIKPMYDLLFKSTRSLEATSFIKSFIRFKSIILFVLGISDGDYH